MTSKFGRGRTSSFTFEDIPLPLGLKSSGKSTTVMCRLGVRACHGFKSCHRQKPGEANCLPSFEPCTTDSRGFLGLKKIGTRSCGVGATLGSGEHSSLANCAFLEMSKHLLSGLISDNHPLVLE